MAAEVLLVSRGLVHPSLLVRRRVRSLLSGSIAGPLETTRSLRRLTALGGARAEGAAARGARAQGARARGVKQSGKGEEPPAAVVLLFHQAEPPAGAVEALERYVHAGGGLLAIHGALASFKTHPRYAALLGSPFAGHAKPGPIDLYPLAGGASRAGGRGRSAGRADSAPSGPPAREPAGRVTDELYRVDLAEDAAVRCVGSRHAAAEEHAICWERRLGAGRVAVVTLGHYAQTLADSFVQQLLTAELEWVAGRGTGTGKR